MELSFILQQVINGLSKGAIYALIAAGFALIFSVLKFSNFAHGGLISISAFAGYFFSSKLGMGLFATIIMSAIVGGAAGVLLDFISFARLRQRNAPNIFYFVSSITSGILFMNILTYFWGTTFYSLPNFFEQSVITLGPLSIVTLDVVAFITSIILLLILVFILNKTRLGLAVRTVAIDGNTAKLMGINMHIIVTSTFFMAGALAGVAGVFLGANFTVDPFLGQMVVKGFVASVVGGLGSFPGAIAGAFLLGIVEVALTIIVGDTVSPAIVFVLTLAFLLIRPQGISGKFIQEKA